MLNDNSRFAIVAASVILLTFACGSKDSAKNGAQAQEQGGGAAALVNALFLKSEPAGAKSVLEIRSSAKNGDDVVVAGRVSEFFDGIAGFTLVDSTLVPCNERVPADECKTPWDYCCNDVTERNQATATIELVDNGKALRTMLQGVNGLDHLKHVVVKGKLTVDEAGNFVVRAEGIHVKS